MSQNNFVHKIPLQDQFLNGGIKAHLSNDDRQELLKNCLTLFEFFFFQDPFFKAHLSKEGRQKLKGCLPVETYTTTVGISDSKSLDVSLRSPWRR